MTDVRLRKEVEGVRKRRAAPARRDATAGLTGRIRVPRHRQRRIRIIRPWRFAGGQPVLVVLYARTRIMRIAIGEILERILQHVFAVIAALRRDPFTVLL